MEDETQVDSTINESEEVEETLDLDDTEDVEVLKEKLQKAEEARRQLTARAKRAEEALKKAPKPESPKLEANAEDKVSDEVIDLRLDGYTRDEVAFIIKNGGRKALENSYVSTAINAMREQRQAEEQASKAKDTSGATSFEKKFPQEKLSKMSAEELAKILPHTDE